MAVAKKDKSLGWRELFRRQFIFLGFSPDGWRCGDGFTDAIDGSNLSNVYLSPNAFTSQWDLYLTMGHELVHVSQFASLKGSLSSLIDAYFREVMEFHAYNYSHSLSSQVGLPSPGNPFNVASLMKHSYYDRLNYLNFEWTYKWNYKYPF